LKRSLGRFYSVTAKQQVVSENAAQKQNLSELITRQIGQGSRRHTPFKPFAANSFVTPYDLTYKGHTKKDPPRMLAQYLAPSRKEARAQDPFYQLGLDPLDFVLNPDVLQAYVTDMGKILPRNRSKLTTKNQRRLGKAIRRARMMGIIPLFSKRNIFSR